MTSIPSFQSSSDETLPFSNFVDNARSLSLKYPSLQSHIEKHTVEPLKSFEILNHKIFDKKKAKKLVRNAELCIDSPVRAKLWLQLGNLLSGNIHSPDAYDEVLKAVYGDEVETFQTTEKSPSKDNSFFIDSRFLPNHHHLNAEGVYSTHRILTVIAFERPDITYAPTLPSLTSILLHYLSEQETYHLLGALLSRTAKERFITQTRISYTASAAVFKKLAFKYFRSACSHLRKGGLDVDTTFTHWIFWIFIHLPFTHLVRVIDCYLYEGPKILYRVALALLHHFDKNKGGVESIEEYCGRIDVSARTLLKTSFRIRGLSRGHMFELMNKREMALSIRYTTFAEDITTSRGSLHVPTNTDSQLLCRNQWRHIYEWLPKRVTLRRPLLLFSTAEHGTSLLTFYQRVEGHNPTLLVLKTTTGEMIGAYLAGDWQERKGGSKYFGTGESFVCQLSPTPVKFAWVGVAGGDVAGVGPCGAKSSFRGDASTYSSNDAGKDSLPPLETPSNLNSEPPPSDQASLSTNHHTNSTALINHHINTSMFATGDATSISIGGGNGRAIQLDSNLLQGCTTPCSTFNNPPLVPSSQFKVATLEVFAFQ